VDVTSGREAEGAEGRGIKDQGGRSKKCDDLTATVDVASRRGAEGAEGRGIKEEEERSATT